MPTLTSTTAMYAARISNSLSRRPLRPSAPRPRLRNSGHTLIEAMLVVFLLALLVTGVIVNLPALIENSRFDDDVARFSDTLQITAEQAIVRGQKLAVVIDIYDGYYTVYEANDEDLYTDELEPLIDRQGLDLCYIDEIELEDGSQKYSGDLIMYATPQGFSASILFVLKDLEDQYRYLRCQRLTTHIDVSRQPLELPQLRTDLSMTSTI